MKNLVLTLLLLLIAVTSSAQIPDEPTVTFLNTDIDILFEKDGYILGYSDYGISSYAYDPVMDKYIHQYYLHFPDGRIYDRKIKIDDSILVLYDHKELLHFFDISDLPRINYISFVDMNFTFSDFAIRGDDLYLSVDFDGVWHFQLEDYRNTYFRDSSMVGVLASQIDIFDDSLLYVLDEYNGILRYNLNAPGFGELIDYLYVPKQVESFYKCDSIFALDLINDNVYLADFRGDSNLVYDSLENIEGIHSIYVTDSLLLFALARELLLFDKLDYTRDTIITSAFNAIIDPNSRESLLDPYFYGGFNRIDLTQGSSEQIMLHGGFRDFVVYNNKLIITSEDEPIYVYDISDPENIVFDYNIYENLGNGLEIENNGDSLIAVFYDLNEVGVILNSTDSANYFFETGIPIGTQAVLDMSYLSENIYSSNLMLLRRWYGIDVYQVSDTGYSGLINQWLEHWKFSSVSTNGSLLFARYLNGKMRYYDINEDFSLTLINEFEPVSNVTETLARGNLVYLFSSNTMYVVDFSNLMNPTIISSVSLPVNIDEAVLSGDKIYSVSTNTINKGVSVIDLSQQTPTYNVGGFRGGTNLSVDGNILGVSQYDERLDLYYLSQHTDANDPVVFVDELPQTTLLQNHPNPFNPTTTISFSLNRSTDVELVVFNILGQQVSNIYSGYLDAGHHKFIWEGVNDDGSQLASGVYLYRLKAGQMVKNKKMMLLK